MASNEGHIHWGGLPDETVNYLGQELELTSEITNAIIVGDESVGDDPIGTIRIRLTGSSLTGLALPTDGWQPIPGTGPPLEARMDGHYPIGYIRIRQQ